MALDGNDKSVNCFLHLSLWNLVAKEILWHLCLKREAPHSERPSRYLQPRQLEKAWI